MSGQLLYSTADLAELLRMSQSWLRKDRMYRRRGLPHVLTIDPVMVGSAPRYRISDVETWLAAQRTRAEGGAV
jgi:hypothetical protein